MLQDLLTFVVRQEGHVAKGMTLRFMVAISAEMYSNELPLSAATEQISLQVRVGQRVV